MNRVLILHYVENSTALEIPLFLEKIRAGFPSPAQDYVEGAIDLNRELIRHPSSTFYGRVSGDSMKDAGLFDGDIVVVDKSINPRDGDMAVCCIDGEFTIKFIKIEKGDIWLIPANEAFQPIRVTSENDFIVWGIVTYSIKNHNQRKCLL